MIAIIIFLLILGFIVLFLIDESKYMLDIVEYILEVNEGHLNEADFLEISTLDIVIITVPMLALIIFNVLTPIYGLFKLNVTTVDGILWIFVVLTILLKIFVEDDDSVTFNSEFVHILSLSLLLTILI